MENLKNQKTVALSEFAEKRGGGGRNGQGEEQKEGQGCI